MSKRRLSPPPRRPGAVSLSRLLAQQQVQKITDFGRACDAAYATGLRAGYLKAGVIRPAKETTA
jgi:hypothetical protein